MLKPIKQSLSFLKGIKNTMGEVGKGIIKGGAEMISGNNPFGIGTLPIGYKPPSSTLTQASNPAQTWGKAVGTLSPSVLSTPWLQSKGVNPLLAGGIGLGLDIIAPGPGEILGAGNKVQKGV